MSELIVLQKNKIYTTSMIIAGNLDLEHDNVVAMIKKYSYLENLSMVQTEKLKTKGRAKINYLLNEEQSLILVSMMKNTPKVIDFKIKLVRAFIKYRQIAQSLVVQRKNQDWVEERQEGKVARRVSTDIIQEFIEYAKAQGSQSADKYYMSITRMQLTGLFLMEQRYPNAREVMNFKQLATTQTADYVIAESLKDSMEKGLHYKDCYKEAKKRIDELEKIIPKSPLPAYLDNGSMGNKQ